VSSGAFFVLRTPLLPFDTIARLGEGLTAPAAAGDEALLAAAIAGDRARIRAVLRDLVHLPAVREAIFVASPHLDAAIDGWIADPASASVVERSLLRYVTRMAARPTPFGLFAGSEVGTIGESTAFPVAAADACRRHTRLDMDYLTRLSEALAGDASLAAALIYRPNSSLYRAADRWRYVETRVRDNERTHHLVAIDDSAALGETLARAAGGSHRHRLAAALVGEDVSAEDAAAFVDALVESHVLVSDLECPVTGVEPIDHLIASCERYAPASPAITTLASIRAELASLDGDGIGSAPSRYRSVADRLASFPVPADASRLFQVDLVKPSGRSVLGENVVEELRRGADLLRRLTPRDDRDELAALRDAFVARYEQREVPLVDALDDDSGFVSALPASGRDASPLLRGLTLPRIDADRIVWGSREAGLLRRVGEVVATRRTELVLEPADVDELATPDMPPLPDAFAIMATVAAADAAACARGDFRVCLHGVAGPSGANLLGRFCHADAVLASEVRRHLAAEAALATDAVFAEVVHLPQGRLGNILLRPVFRDYEIPYLAASGAAADRQLPITDLTLAVVDGEFVLRSRRLGRRVIPRLTTAHNFRAGSLDLYRLLCLLQSQGRQGACTWSWGVLSSLSFLPRVTCGRLVLSRATWSVTAKEIRALRGPTDVDRFRRVQVLRATRNLPRWVVVADGDHALPVDLDNVLGVDSFVHLLGGRQQATLVELYPGPDELCARGPDGGFVHEIILPMIAKTPESTTTNPTRTAPVPVIPPLPRTFPPGSTWVYAKVYTGAGTADVVLRDVVGPVSRALKASGDIDLWFFIRYGDSDPHLRWRLHAGDPGKVGRVRQAVESALAPLVGDQRVGRLAFDTYEREIERYGGTFGMLASERLFWADSDAAIDVIECLSRNEATDDLRWRLALCGTDDLLDDLGLANVRLGVMTGLRDRFGREFGVDAAVRRQLAEKYRAVRPVLADGIARASTHGPAMLEGLAAFHVRSVRLCEIVRHLREHESDRRLTSSIRVLAESYVHLHVNRLLRSEHRLHELVIYDFLARLYAELRAREAAAARRHVITLTS
jgi:thiopeptide-type bacteriocin biosynthesis protein